jgi:3-oxoacyl-[acyl-carrier protein] reductase
MKLADRVALVTGGGSGIGRAIVLRFVEEGARVVVNDIRLDAARKVLDELGPDAARGHVIEADVADSGRVRAMFAEVESRFGRLDILVNNAGIGSAGDERRPEIAAKAQARAAEAQSSGVIQTHWDVTQAMSDETWNRMLAVHLNGTFHCTREALKLMSRRPGGGVIINVSSIAALAGLETVPHYSAAKAGILGFTRAVAREVASRNIRVNAICPGFIDTPMTESMPSLMRAGVIARTPLGRMGEPEEIAATAAFLASDDARFFTGQWLSPNGGLFIG